MNGIINHKTNISSVFSFYADLHNKRIGTGKNKGRKEGRGAGLGGGREEGRGKERGSRR